METTAPARRCVPGAYLVCACGGGFTGVQACNAQGSGLLACVCGRGAPRGSGAEERAASAPTLLAGTSAGPRWYGWQVLIPDAIALALFSSSALSHDRFGPLGLAGAVVYGIGGPGVHWFHGRIGEGFGSVGLRLLGAGVGFGLALITPASGLAQDLLIIGPPVVAMLVDIALNSTETRTFARTRAVPHSTWGLGFAPTPGQGLSVSLGGAF